MITSLISHVDKYKGEGDPKRVASSSDEGKGAGSDLDPRSTSDAKCLLQKFLYIALSLRFPCIKFHGLTGKKASASYA